MIQANELRKGSFVNVLLQPNEPITVQVHCIDSEGGVLVNGLEIPFSFEDLHPIKLTEDWLIKFGFVRDVFDNDKNEYSHPELPRSTVLRFSPIKLGFVHQLQNWFSAYTGGQELTIK